MSLANPDINALGRPIPLTRRRRGRVLLKTLPQVRPCDLSIGIAPGYGSTPLHTFHRSGKACLTACVMFGFRRYAGITRDFYLHSTMEVPPSSLMNGPNAFCNGSSSPRSPTSTSPDSCERESGEMRHEPRVTLTCQLQGTISVLAAWIRAGGFDAAATTRKSLISCG